MGSLKTDEERQSTGPIGKASSRWSCVTLMVLTFHTLLIATCLILFFSSTNFRFPPEEPQPTDTNTGIILQLGNRGGIKPNTIQWSNVKQGLLNFTLMYSIKEIRNIKVNGSDIKVGCQGPYILYPYIEHFDENYVEEVFNLTVVNREARVLASIPFNTSDKTTWKHRIINLNKDDDISVYVDCIQDELNCRVVGEFCLGLNFLLGSVCPRIQYND
ncbi:uncharacterized protein LOC121677814 [Alosa sapidissima]|uniref:uncharacterized protein LOC121677814 n=1 Tax=Alosa sapidissima TaxID=34773 RepID=UPI001C08B44E|nr:uncharacterized protein LOC121677814 [Alosa sapidissima]